MIENINAIEEFNFRIYVKITELEFEYLKEKGTNFPPQIVKKISLTPRMETMGISV